MPWDAAQPHGGFSTGEPWLPVPDAHLSLAVVGQEADAGSVLHLCRRLIALRRASAALRHGSVRPLPAPPPLLAFERIAGEERMLCVFNLGTAPAIFDLSFRGEMLVTVGEVDRDNGRLGPLAAVMVTSV